MAGNFLATWVQPPEYRPDDCSAEEAGRRPVTEGLKLAITDFNQMFLAQK
jgi:hypothetical protein